MRYPLQNPFSIVMVSNLYTMGVAAKTDSRQAIPGQAMIPDHGTRRLRAQLVLEEALETVHALGFAVFAADKSGSGCVVEEVDFIADRPPNLEQIIDGACDTIYVATGTMAVCGVSDMPHLAEVCKANDRKFPGGVAITNSNGKFQKPEGWVGPDHKKVMADLQELDMSQACRDAIELGAKDD